VKGLKKRRKRCHDKHSNKHNINSSFSAQDLEKKSCQISFGDSIFDGANIERKSSDVSDRLAIEGKSIECQSNSKTKNNVAENMGNKTSSSSERLSIYGKSIGRSNDKLIVLIDYIIASQSINNSNNNIERLTYIGKSIQNILKTLNSELSDLILYLGFKFSVFFCGLIKRIPYRISTATISRRLQLLANNNFIRLVGDNEFLREKEVWKYSVSRYSKNPTNAERIKFYTLTDFGQLVVKTFLNEIEDKIKPFIGRINELRDAFLRDLKLVRAEAKRMPQKAQWYRCDFCGRSYAYEIAVKNHFRCIKCKKPLKPVW